MKRAILLTALLSAFLSSSVTAWLFSAPSLEAQRAVFSGESYAVVRGGQVRALLDVTREGEVFLSMTNGTSSETVAVGATASDGSFIDLRDSAGRSRFTITLDRTGKPRMWMADETGAVTWSAP
jgi:hypothetical protein